MQLLQPSIAGGALSIAGVIGPGRTPEANADPTGAD